MSAHENPAVCGPCVLCRRNPSVGQSRTLELTRLSASRAMCAEWSEFARSFLHGKTTISMFARQQLRALLFFWTAALVIGSFLATIVGILIHRLHTSGWVVSSVAFA